MHDHVEGREIVDVGGTKNVHDSSCLEERRKEINSTERIHQRMN